MKRMKVNKSALVAHIVLICFVLFCTLPTLLLVTSSLSDNDSVFRNGYSFWPKEWSLEAYRYMATQGQTIFRAYGISILTTFIGTVPKSIETIGTSAFDGWDIHFRVMNYPEER